MRAELLSDRGAGLPVVYVPGIDGTGELLLGTAQRLEERFRLLRLRYVAEPASAAVARESDTYAALAASCAEAVRAQGVDTCLVVAESFGGGVALQFALDHPDLVRGLVVVNSFARFPAQVRVWLGWKLSALVPRFAFDLFRKLLAPRLLFAERRDQKAIAEFRELWGTFFDHGYRRRMGMITRLDLRPRLGDLAQPLMLLASDRDRVVPSVRTLGELHELAPNSTLEVIPGAGHLILPLEELGWPERIDELRQRAGL